MILAGTTKKHLARIAIFVVAVYLGLCAYLYANQDSMAMPGGMLNLPAVDREGVQTAFFTLSDGTVLRGGYASPDPKKLHDKGLTAEFPTVLYFGGNAEDATAILPALAKATGRVAVAYNYRGFAGSEGEPSLETFESDALEVYRYTVTGSARREGSPVAVLGRSVGTGAALAVAASSDVDELVLVSPYDSLSAVAAEALRWFPVRLLMRHDIDAAASAEQVKEATLVVLAGEDAEIPLARSRALVSALVFPPTVLEVAGAGHNDLLARPEAWGAVADFLKAR